MPSSFSINVDLSEVIGQTGAITKEVFPRLHQAVGAVAQAAQSRWMQAVYKAPGIWQEEKDRYAASIQWRFDGDFAAVVWTDEKVAEWIESGRPERDLKKMLDTSPKVRRTESGKRFLVIPLRHNTPGHGAHAQAMPESVYAMASQMAKSSITSMGQRPAGEVTKLSPKTGMSPSGKQTQYLSDPTTKSDFMVPKRNYQWGDRLKVANTAPQMFRGRGAGAPNAAVRRAWADQYKHYNGMVRMETSTPGGASSSSYMTFRILMEGQSGWVVPAKPGMWIARSVATDLAPLAEKAFQKAVSLDSGQ